MYKAVFQAQSGREQYTKTSILSGAIIPETFFYQIQLHFKYHQ